MPDELADVLIDEGFEEFIAFRGALGDAGTVLSVASASLAAGANITTIVVARESAGQFVAALRSWVRRKAVSQAGGELAIDVSARRGDSTRRVRIKVESSDGASDIDTAALTAFVVSVFGDNPSSEAGNVSSV